MSEVPLYLEPQLRLLPAPKLTGVVPRTPHVNLRIVREPKDHAKNFSSVCLALSLALPLSLLLSRSLSRSLARARARSLCLSLSRSLALSLAPTISSISAPCSPPPQSQQICTAHRAHQLSNVQAKNFSPTISSVLSQSCSTSARSFATAEGCPTTGGP